MKKKKKKRRRRRKERATDGKYLYPRWRSFIPPPPPRKRKNIQGLIPSYKRFKWIPPPHSRLAPLLPNRSRVSREFRVKICPFLVQMYIFVISLGRKILLSCGVFPLKRKRRERETFPLSRSFFKEWEASRAHRAEGTRG